MNIWKTLNKPIKVLSPMAGYTDSAFRILCRELGCDLVITELISADAIFHQSHNWFKDESGVWKSTKSKDETLQMLQFDERERPIVIQLFGKFPEKFAFAAKWISENLKPDGIDINMGCPARKVVGSDHGAALLKNPELAVGIVKAVKANTDLPVSVKTRLGWDVDDQILEFAPKLAEAGIDALIIHGRTYKDGFKGKARWENIYKVKKMVGESLIVIGNGDINQNTEDRIQNSALDGFAIGRGVVGQPWIFLKDNVTKDELKSIALRHAKLVFETKGDHGLVEFRKHLLLYLRGFPGAKELRKNAVAVKEISDVEAVLNLL